MRVRLKRVIPHAVCRGPRVTSCLWFTTETRRTVAGRRAGGGGRQEEQGQEVGQEQLLE